MRIVERLGNGFVHRYRIGCAVGFDCWLVHVALLIEMVRHYHAGLRRGVPPAPYFLRAFENVVNKNARDS